MAGLGSFLAGLMRDGGIGQKIWREFGIEGKSGSGIGQKYCGIAGKAQIFCGTAGLRSPTGAGLRQNIWRDAIRE